VEQLEAAQRRFAAETVLMRPDSGSYLQVWAGYPIRRPPTANQFCGLAYRFMSSDLKGQFLDNAAPAHTLIRVLGEAVAVTQPQLADRTPRRRRARPQSWWWISAVVLVPVVVLTGVDRAAGH
jgi:hypothetical protein